MRNTSLGGTETMTNSMACATELSSYDGPIFFKLPSNCCLGKEKCSSI